MPCRMPMLVVTNHDLVLVGPGPGRRRHSLPAPADAIYIFDEGHHLPEKALNHFSGFCRLGSTLQWLDDCRRQQLSQAAGALAGTGAGPGRIS